MDRRALCAALVAAIGLGGCGGSRPAAAPQQQPVQLPTTTAAPRGGDFDAATEVTLTSSMPATIHFSLDGSDPAIGAQNTTSGDSPLTVQLPEGESELRFFAVDPDGNREAAIRTEAYLVDTTPPVVVLVTHPPAPVGVLAAAQLRWYSSEAGTYAVELGGDGQRGSGEPLQTGAVRAEELRSVRIPAVDLPEDGAVSVWIHAEDWTGRVGSLEVPVERAAPVRVSLGYAPGDVVALPGGDRAYVARKFGRELDVLDIDPSSPQYLAIVNTIDVGIRPWAVSATPDGARLYVSNAISTGAIAVVETATDSLEETISGVGIPGGIAFSPDGRFGYFTDYEGQILVLATDPFNPARHTIVDSIFVGDGMLSGTTAISPDGRALLNWTGQVHRTDLIDLDPTSFTYRRIIASPVGPTGAWAGGVAVSSDSSFGYASSSDPQCGLCRINLATGEVEATAPLHDQAGGVVLAVSGITIVDFAWSLALTADDRYLLAVGPNGRTMRIYRTDTTEEIAQVSVGSGAVAVAITPDGTRAVVARSGSTPELIVVPLREPRRTGGPSPGTPAYKGDE